MKNALCILTLMSLLLTSCIAPQNPSSIRAGSSDAQTEGGGSGNGSGGGDGKGAGPDDNDLGNNDTQVSAKVEITQIVDPNTGTFRKKVSIPKDFEGYLYLSGLNISSLKDKIISVRFYFGRERSSVTIPAVVGRVPGGLQPLSSLDVIILDIDNKPFRDLRLLYDLFDYNDYDETGTVKDPTQDPTNAGLYCRGLLLEDDPTFEGSISNTACDAAGETCYYAYAKVSDSGLYKFEADPDGNMVEVTDRPLYEQYDKDAKGYASETDATNLRKCLPDNNDVSNFNGVLGSSLISLTFGSALTLDSTAHVYKGPFRLFAEADWQISGGAIFNGTPANPNGLFQTAYSIAQPESGYKSYLFPRAGKINYSQAGVQYFGSDSPFGVRTLQVLPGAGDTKWMDGCNLRAKNYDQFTGETISSCNVTATVEVITTVDGKEQVLASSKEVKLQLLKSGLGVTTGQAFSALKTCSDNRSCGSGECCFNSRCWSRDVVGQCSDDFTGVGNLGTGESCGTDFDCASLCCNSTTKVCSDHINTDLEKVLCSKVPGQSCVSREYCRQENVRECYIIKTTDSNGNPSCEKKCFSVPKFGDCINGTCQPPTSASDPAFDPTDPNRCDGALDSAPVTL
jgi:hypothetical protein